MDMGLVQWFPVPVVGESHTFFLLMTYLLTLFSRSLSLFVQDFSQLAEITVLFTFSNSCPEKANRSAVDLGARPVNTFIGDMYPSALDSLVFRLYCTSGTISGHRSRLHDGPDSL